MSIKRIDYRPVTVEHDGQKWSGRWSVEGEGKAARVMVDSAYGHGAKAPGADPKATAAQLLALQVSAYCKASGSRA